MHADLSRQLPGAPCAGVFDRDSQRFALEIDEAAQSHMAWTRRLLRCAVLRSAPDDDPPATDAHLRCPFALWSQRHRQRFDELDAEAARRLEAQHRQMHEAARSICRRIAAGRPGDAGEPVFRLGGEEFLALLQPTDRAAAEHAAERVLQAFRDNPLGLPDGRCLNVRASAGLAEVGDKETVSDAVARTDRTLYAVKAGGRHTWRWAAAVAQRTDGHA